MNLKLSLIILGLLTGYFNIVKNYDFKSRDTFIVIGLELYCFVKFSLKFFLDYILLSLHNFKI